METLQSRQRLIRALEYQETDYIPCCLMSCSILRKRHNEDRYKAALAEKEMGLDPMMFIPSASRWERPDHPDLRGLPIQFHPDVEMREWREEVQDDFDILHKEYHTPAGKLTTSVRLSDDWYHGDHIPFVDDYQIPRSLDRLVSQPEDLEALQYLLIPPGEELIAEFKTEAKQAHAFAQENDMLLVGGWGVGLDMTEWLCGMQEVMLLMMDDPDFLGDLLEIIHQWNKQRMKVVLSENVDLYIRRAWYEGSNFFYPSLYEKEVFPRIKAEAELAHEYGAKFGYICTTGTIPLLDYYSDLGIDVLVGVDPVQDVDMDLTVLKEKLGGHLGTWGGVSGAVTVERGTEQEVREAVRTSIQTLGPTGHILSPVDNLTVDDPRSWENLDIFIDEWKKVR